MKFDINILPVKVRNGSMTIKEAVNKLTEFTSCNPAVFGLEIFDEDFRSEIYVKILEKGYSIFTLFNPNQGDFFSLYYSFIKSLIHTHLKYASRKTFNERIFLQTCMENYNEKQNKLSDTTQDFSLKNAPYESEKLKLEKLRNVFKNQSTKRDKSNIILALKSAFYLDDEFIRKFCIVYDLDQTEFTDIIQRCKNDQLSKIERNTVSINKRNYAYFFHKKYAYELDKINNEKNVELIDTTYEHKLKNKNKSHTIKWKRNNQKLKTSSIYIRTSNKLIAELLNICERQVSYYVERRLKESLDDSSIQNK